MVVAGGIQQTAGWRREQGEGARASLGLNLSWRLRPPPIRFVKSLWSVCKFTLVCLDTVMLVNLVCLDTVFLFTLVCLDNVMLVTSVCLDTDMLDTLVCLDTVRLVT